MSQMSLVSCASNLSVGWFKFLSDNRSKVLQVVEA